MWPQRTLQADSVWTRHPRGGTGGGGQPLPAEGAVIQAGAVLSLISMARALNPAVFSSIKTPVRA